VYNMGATYHAAQILEENGLNVDPETNPQREAATARVFYPGPRDDHSVQYLTEHSLFDVILQERHRWKELHLGGNEVDHMLKLLRSQSSNPLPRLTKIRVTLPSPVRCGNIYSTLNSRRRIIYKASSFKVFRHLNLN